MVTLVLAIVINRDELNLINLIGLIICLGGITLHVILKAIRIHKETKTSSGSGSIGGASISRKRVGEEEFLMAPLISDNEETEVTVYEVRK